MSFVRCRSARNGPCYELKRRLPQQHRPDLQTRLLGEHEPSHVCVYETILGKIGMSVSSVDEWQCAPPRLDRALSAPGAQRRR